MLNVFNLLLLPTPLSLPSSFALDLLNFKFNNKMHPNMLQVTIDPIVIIAGTTLMLTTLNHSLLKLLKHLTLKIKDTCSFSRINRRQLNPIWSTPKSFHANPQLLAMLKEATKAQRRTIPIAEP